MRERARWATKKNELKIEVSDENVCNIWSRKKQMLIDLYI